MKTLIIYASFHHKNTEKIAKEISDVLDAKIINFYDVTEEDIKEADLIGFGSGVYYSKFHRGLIKFVESLSKMDKKKAFLFSTSGLRKNIFLNRSHHYFKKTLKEKNFNVVGEFRCLAYDTYGPFKCVGGLNKGRPNEKDFKDARAFAMSLIK